MSILKKGVPSEATLCRVDNGINELGMSDRMQEFIEGFHSQLHAAECDREIICIDGKALLLYMERAVQEAFRQKKRYGGAYEACVYELYQASALS